ncbi:hypothetical protein E4U55_007626 [Claviceps digitariae]|nr:hypothetical protein E4U55_007626 [Claviceps digitariae]
MSSSSSSCQQHLFIALLRDQHVLNQLISHLSTPDVTSIRQVSSACCNLVTKQLFTRIHTTFTASTFTKASRVAALKRIGHHVEHLTVHMPHSEATFLPPLIHPVTGQEICFLYAPHTSMASVLTRPKYANAELGGLLTQQYPPLFHAATNVASFIHAFSWLPNMRHLTVRCPGQDPRERYRRSIVDYVLISLRIAVEKAPLEKLHKLSLSSVHPAAFHYLRHTQGFGSLPSAGRRWRQIRKLNISVECWDFNAPLSPGLDHLKIIDDYVRFFAPGLDKFSFAWVEPATNSNYNNSINNNINSHNIRGPCPVSLASDALLAPPRSSRKLFHEVTSPMSPLPSRPPRSPIHFPRLRYLQLRNVTMKAPQLSELIKRHSQTVKMFDFENVVLANRASWDEALAPLSGDACWVQSRVPAAASSCSLVSHESEVELEEEEELPSPSAAVEAASRELLELGLSGLGVSREERRIIAGMSDGMSAASVTTSRADETMGFTTRLRRTKTRRRRRKHSHGSTNNEDHGSPELRPPPLSSSSSSSSSSPSHHHHHQRETRKPSRSRSSSTPNKPPLDPDPNPNPITITAPILTSKAHPVLLQPTVYHSSRSSRPPSHHELPSVQRNLEQEATHRLLAHDPTARATALQKAKQAVLSKLSREFCVPRPRATDAVAACRLALSREWSSGADCARDMVLEDRMRCDSQSTLVPLMFRRS